MIEETLEGPPWLDLPDPLQELVLERLPLSDYIRYGGVCRKWRSIQRAHRLRHAPGPPPVLSPLPWLIPSNLNLDSCYSPFDRTLHRLRPSSAALTHRRCLASAHGWLLLLHLRDLSLSLLNPITSAHINLPPVSLSYGFNIIGAGAMSAPPTHPHCTLLLLLLDADYVFLHNLNNGSWIQLPLPHLPLHSPMDLGPSVVFSGDTFYCMAGGWLYAVDPRPPAPAVRFLDMDCSRLPRVDGMNYSLAELGREVLLVVAPSDERFDIMEFQVFRADISGGAWVRAHTLGDRSLFLHERCSFSLLAADVGCKKNCIYYLKALARLESRFSAPAKLVEVFDIETGGWTFEDPETELDLSQFDNCDAIWIVPKLDHVNPGEVLNLDQQ